MSTINRQRKSPKTNKIKRLKKQKQKNSNLNNSIFKKIFLFISLLI